MASAKIISTNKVYSSFQDSFSSEDDHCSRKPDSAELEKFEKKGSVNYLLLPVNIAFCVNLSDDQPFRHPTESATVV
ncbi:MAG: hypothetical protein LBE79_12105, partial [Tannerella sp.]|nr:hypothetical protein [Tannerella sp.]